MSKGLRQGDPLSPLLYIQVSEFLHLLIDKAIELNLIRGIDIDDQTKLSHLQFVDDTILILENKTKSILGIKKILIIFQMLKGLKVNFSKSNIYTANKDQEQGDQWARMLGCRIGNFPFQYLGATIGGNSGRKNYWFKITKRVKTTLNKCRSRYLSKAGRLILIKAVIDAIPTYWISNHKLPLGIQKEIEKIKRDFYWGLSEEEGLRNKKLHMIRWEIICNPKKRGGLGVKVLAWKNAALLAKWWWRAKLERSSLWYKLLTNKYGETFLSDPMSRNNKISPMIKSIAATSEFSELIYLTTKTSSGC